MLTCEVTQASQEKVNRLLSVAFAPQAAHALTRAAMSGKTAMVKAIAEDLGTKQAAVKPYVWMTPATADNLVARIHPNTHNGIPLIKLGATGPEPSRGKGRIRVKLAGTFTSAFIATMPSGHRGVFQRKGKARLPIQELRTSSISDVFRKVRPVGIARALESLRTNLVADLKFALKKSA